MESRTRTIAKTFSWRFFATFITMIVAWIITGKPESGFVIGAADTIIKLFGYYYHERAWIRISLGNEERSENSVHQTVDSVVLQQGQSDPVMLVLSSKEKPNKAIELAFEKAEDSKFLILVYVIKVNLNKYFVETDAGLYPDLKKECEKELLDKFREDSGKEIKEITDRANSQGIKVKEYIQTEVFSLKNNEIIISEKPVLIVLSYSKKIFSFLNFFKSQPTCSYKDISIPVIEI